MPGAFNVRYQGSVGKTLASKDTQVQELTTKIQSFKSHLERIVLFIDELSGTYRDLCTEVNNFYTNDSEGLADDVLEGYRRITDAMAGVVPRKVTEILRTKVVKSCDDWLLRLDAVRAQQDSKELLDAAERVKHYEDKIAKIKDSKSIARQQEKLAAATADYDAVVAPISREMTTVLVGQKAEYSKLVVRVMQFQQAYFKQAHTSCDMMPLMDTLRDLVESNAWEAGEIQRLQSSVNGTSRGADEDHFDSSDDEVIHSSNGSKKMVDASVIAFNKLADDLEEMFWGGRTPRERDLTAMKDAMYDLNSKLLSCPKSNRKELRARIDALDSKWKQAVDVHMKLELHSNQPYTGGIQKQKSGSGPANQAVPVPPQPDPVSTVDVSSVPPEHMDMLKNDPSLAPEFDQIYGDGTAAKILGIAPRPVAAVEVEPSDEHIDMLLKDPSLAPKFDNFYGNGAAQRILDAQQQGNPTSPPPAPVNSSCIPPEHAEMLRQDPTLAEEFERIYGAGSAAEVLASPSVEVKFSVPPEHVAKLRAHPEFAAKFDAKYGAGAAQYYLGGTPPSTKQQQQEVQEPQVLNVQVHTMMEGQIQKEQAEAAKQAAIDKYHQKRLEASPRSPNNSVDTGPYEMIQEAASPVANNYEQSTVPDPTGANMDMLGCYNQLPAYPPMTESTPTAEPSYDQLYSGVSEQPYSNQQVYPEQSYADPASVPPEAPPQEHIDMLLGDPSFAEQFDEVYGVGRSQYYLTQNAMLNSVPADVSSEATPVSSMLSAPAMPRDSFGYDYSQGDSDEDIISTTSYPVMSQQQAVAMPPQQPKVVDDYDFFPADNSPSVPMAPVQTTLSPQQGLAEDPEASDSPRTVKWRQVNQQRVAMGLQPKPHPGPKV